MIEKDERLADAHAELIKLRDERDKVIDAYIKMDEFVQVMKAHDDAVFPGFKIRWDA